MHKYNNTRSGFTIVELLIVVVVIALLAAISLIAYTNFQNRALDSVVRSDLAAIAKSLDIAKVDLGRYPQSNSEFPDGFKFSKSAYDDSSLNIYYCLNRSASDSYGIKVRSKSGAGFQLHNGVVTSGVSVDASSTCALVGTTWSSSDPTFFGRSGVSSLGWNPTSHWKWL